MAKKGCFGENFVVEVFIMKTLKTNQYKVAEWLGVKAPTLSNILSGNRRPSRKEALRLAGVSGVSFEDWMLSDGKQLRQKVFIAYAMAHENKSRRAE